MSSPGHARLIVENTGSGKEPVIPGHRATIIISEPAGLCSAQWATREICRALGFDEAGVYSAVIAVSNFAHKELVEGGGGKLHLAALKERGRAALEAKIERSSGPT